MISLIIKLSTVLKPFHKVTYLLALLIVTNIAYQLLFSTEHVQIEDKEAMLSLLALAWLALVNLMLHVFTRVPENKENKQPLFTRIKNKLHQWLYSILFFVFIALSISLIILSFKMLRL